MIRIPLDITCIKMGNCFFFVDNFRQIFRILTLIIANSKSKQWTLLHKPNLCSFFFLLVFLVCLWLEPTIQIGSQKSSEPIDWKYCSYKSIWFWYCFFFHFFSKRKNQNESFPMSISVVSGNGKFVLLFNLSKTCKPWQNQTDLRRPLRNPITWI